MNAIPVAEAETGLLEDYFASFRDNIVGNRQSFISPFGTKEIVYADWTASGRAYRPIEEKMIRDVLPFVANTHTETTITGTRMTSAYNEARRIVKKHVNAADDDLLIFCGSGMTAAVNKLQRILGWRVPEQFSRFIHNAVDLTGAIDLLLKPVVFITHMEHHSNHISWLETIADVEIIQPADDGNVDISHLEWLLEKYKQRKNKAAAITACSNVTGIQTPISSIAKLMHVAGGSCFIDFACSAPYVNIDMHPEEGSAYLDAIYFSPHKFLGGPGTPGVLLFNKRLYHSKVPDHPGGGTILYSNPWKSREYIAAIEEREDGGTPPFLGAIKAALSLQLKENMGTDNIRKREKHLTDIVLRRMSYISNLQVLEEHCKERLGIISFIVRGVHHNLFVKLLNDRFGIQSRGGCSCAGTYGHYILRIDEERSHSILHHIRDGNLLSKPGWVRLSFHPCMTDKEIDFIMDAVELTAMNLQEWMKDYEYDAGCGQFVFKADPKNVIP